MLQVRDLVVEIPTLGGVARPVDGVNFDIAAGEILGVVGESGAGNSMTGAVSAWSAVETQNSQRANAFS